MTKNEMPKFIADWFSEKEESGEYECMDNFRWALTGDAEQMGKFEDIEAGGCCGSHNETIQAPDGAKWLVGFNYGH